MCARTASLCRVSARVALLALACAATRLHAQQQGAPRAGYVYPAGGQRGTTVQVQIGGQLLNGVSGALVSGAGVRARVLEYDRPLNAQALTNLRDTAQALQRELQRGGGTDAALRERLLQIRDRIASSVLRQANPSLAEIVRLEVTIAADAEPGARRLRLITPAGVTAPLVFAIGELPELREKTVKLSRADDELAITLPAVVNGQLIPGDADRNRTLSRNAQQYRSGDVDRYRFHAVAGQEIVAVVSARALVPYLADAVPGWLQATLRLYDAAGRELVYVDDYRFDPDPVLHYRIPSDGEYVLEIADALFRGRDDFVYRIAIGELPYITNVFPLGARAGDRSEVALSGWNLPAHRIAVESGLRAPGIQSIVAHGARVSSNALPFARDTLPELVEREPNDAASRASRVTLPVIVNGRIDEPGDHDVFRFTGRAGAHIVAEVRARRLGSPLDAVLELTDAAGTRVAWNDDHDDAGAALETHHADSWLSAKLPADGTYYVRIGDIQRKGGAEYAYRLRLSAPRPDFELRVAPSFISASAGTTVPVTVLAIRRDGFAGDIAVAIEDAIPGMFLSGAMIPAGQDRIRMTLTVPPAGAASARASLPRPGAVRRAAVRSAGDGAQQAGRQTLVELTLTGSATIDGRNLVRHAVPADDMMQAFAYHHYVAADRQALFVRTRGAIAAPASIRSALPLRIPAGGSARVEVGLPPGYRLFDNLQFQLSEPPPGLTLAAATLTDGGAVLTLHADATASQAEQRGNLIVEVSGERPPGPNADAAQRRQRVVLGVLPALSFEVGR